MLFHYYINITIATNQTLSEQEDNNCKQKVTGLN